MFTILAIEINLKIQNFYIFIYQVQIVKNIFSDGALSVPCSEGEALPNASDADLNDRSTSQHTLRHLRSVFSIQFFRVDVSICELAKRIHSDPPRGSDVESCKFHRFNYFRYRLCTSNVWNRTLFGRVTQHKRLIDRVRLAVDTRAFDKFSALLAHRVIYDDDGSVHRCFRRVHRYRALLVRCTILVGNRYPHCNRDEPNTCYMYAIII